MKNIILQGDVKEVLKTIPDKYVNCVVTSPPYFGLRDYGTAKWDGGDSGCDHKAPPMHGSVKTSTLNLAKKREESSSFVATEPQYRDICKKCGAKRIDAQLGLEKTPEEYVSNMVEVFREVKRVLRADGTLWLNLGDSYAGPKGNTRGDGAGGGKERGEAMGFGTIGNNKVPPGLKTKDLVGIPWMVAFALRADGWYLRSDIIWHKPNPMPESVKDRCTKAHEYVFLLTKSAKYYYDHEAIKEPAVCAGQSRGKSRNISPKGMSEMDNKQYDTRNKRSVWTISTKPFKEAHFATFPPDLIEPMILAGCPEDGIVLDPFFGAGTTGLVSKKLNRNYIGIELNSEYCELAKNRIENT